MKATLLTLLIACTVVACKTTQVSLSPVQVFTLPYQQPTTVQPAGTGAVKAKLTQVQESRCPSDVVCITGGNVSVTVELTDASATHTARLGYDKNYRLDSMEVTLNSQAYWLRLLDVTPYPTTKNIGQSKEATLRLRPR